MRQYSFLLTTRRGADRCIIEWDTMDTDRVFKSSVLKGCYEDAKRPKTLQEVAERFDNTKLIGYIDSELLIALQELNQHLVPYGSCPQLYYELENTDDLWCLEFFPKNKHVRLLTYTFGHLLPIENEDEFASERRRIMATLPERTEWKSV